MLNDAHILKDVLRQHTVGQDTHTVHLVYTPKNRPIVHHQPSATKTSSTKVNPDERHRPSFQSYSGSDGLRYLKAKYHTGYNFQQVQYIFEFYFRHRSSGVESNASTSSTPLQNASINYLNTSQSFMPATNFAQPNVDQSQIQYTPEQYAMAQQMAMQNMMHQMYVQYINQYAASMQQSNPYFQQANFGNINNTGGTTLGSDSRPQPQPQPQVQHDAAAPVQPPRLQPAADEEAENRDWLEILYTLSRLLVLLSLVYFYSSPVRCMIVILAFVLYYL